MSSRKTSSRIHAAGTLAVAALACTVALFAGCTKEPELLFTGDYSSWTKTVKTPLTYPIPGHGERMRKIYINTSGTQVKKSVDENGRVIYTYPPGTIVLKENYADIEGTSLMNLTIMLKAPDDERALGGWVWINKNPATGEERIFSESKFCFNCHTGANKSNPYGDGNPKDEFRDYTFYPYHPPQPGDSTQ